MVREVPRCLIWQLFCTRGRNPVVWTSESSAKMQMVGSKSSNVSSNYLRYTSNGNGRWDEARSCVFHAWTLKCIWCSWPMVSTCVVPDLMKPNKTPSSFQPQSVSSSQEDDYLTQSWVTSIIVLHQNRQALIEEQKALSWINRFMILLFIYRHRLYMSFIYQLHSKHLTGRYNLKQTGWRKTTNKRKRISWQIFTQVIL